MTLLSPFILTYLLKFFHVGAHGLRLCHVSKRTPGVILGPVDHLPDSRLWDVARAQCGLLVQPVVLKGKSNLKAHSQHTNSHNIYLEGHRVRNLERTILWQALYDLHRGLKLFFHRHLDGEWIMISPQLPIGQHEQKTIRLRSAERKKVLMMVLMKRYAERFCSNEIL